MSLSSTSELPTELDLATVAWVVAQHPVRSAVLFGSHARGTNTVGSDVDVAVEFDGSMSDEQRLQRRIDLVVELGDALGIDEIDVADLETIQPEVGVSVLRHGTILFGDRDRLEHRREEFERTATTRTHEERMEQFDSILDRLKRSV